MYLLTTTPPQGAKGSPAAAHQAFGLGHDRTVVGSDDGVDGQPLGVVRRVRTDVEISHRRTLPQA